MEFLDLTTLITIAVAVFVLLRLRSVLGQRTGHQEPHDDALKNENDNRANREASMGDNVVKLPNQGQREDAIDPVIAEIDELAKPRTKLNKGLKAIYAKNPQFGPKEFLSGAEMAYEMIVTAFADGDRKTLNGLLGKDVFEGFVSVIEDRESRDETVKSSFVGIDASEIKSAEQADHESRVTVRFVSQIVSATLDKDGNLIDGDESQVATVKDIWTFARDSRNRDPNWKLVATETDS